MKSYVIAAALVLASTAALAQSGAMKGSDRTAQPSASAAKHVAKGTVRSVNAQAGTVSLHHEPVKTLNWPAMTMNFKVQDKALLEKLGPGKPIEFEFEQRGRDYVITSAR